jgi:hypothetical protein
MFHNTELYLQLYLLLALKHVKRFDEEGVVDLLIYFFGRYKDFKVPHKFFH